MKVTDSHSVKDLTELSIFRGETYVGILRRTTKGCEIKFDPTFINNDSYKTFTYRLQKREAISTYAGVNLPPFFAGLLPEGLRLKALIEELKTSTDDLFSLLTASGESTIGDIFVTTELLTRPKLTISDVKRIDFYEIFQNTLKTGVMAKGEDGIAGIQEKVSASMISFPIHVAKRDKSYILKLNPRDKPNLVQNEFQCLKLAQKCGIETANAKLVSDMNDNSALLIERFDRLIDENKREHKIHQEDACQFLNRYPADKYRLSYQEICHGIQELATAPQIELLKAIQLYAFSYLIGNGDLHAKNISLQTDHQTRRVQLTPAYDLICTYIYKDQKMALKFDGRDDNFKRKHFIKFGACFDLQEKAIHQSLDKLIERITKNQELLFEIPELNKKTHQLQKAMFEKRVNALK